MTWEDIFKTVGAVVFSLGGGGAIVIAFSSYLGKIWADRILEADKAKYQSELEKVKRYSEKQFYFYNELWSALCDLKIKGDALWERANIQSAKRFSIQLKETKDQVTKSSLLIEDVDYIALKKVLEEFGEFDLGKAKLIQLRNLRYLEDVDNQIIEEVIELNRQKKEAYSNLLEKIETSFKKQIRGEIKYNF
ncbi:MAG: hypothetical protein HY231_07345 [Acidobacteria bacterium]|nr:hypothetical protein [Acidobacteriota bacterium]